MPEEDKDCFKNVMPNLMQTIRAASGLAAQDVKFYKSIDPEISKEIDERGQDLLQIINDLVKCTSSRTNKVTTIKYGEEYMQTGPAWNSVSSVIEHLFEKLDHEFDQKKRLQSAYREHEKQYLEDGVTSSGTLEQRSHRITKPQLSFKTPIDNSEEEPFKPKLRTKPNALQSLELVSQLVNPEPVYEDSVEVVDPPFYRHPYEYEIDKQPYPSAVLEKSTPIQPQEWTKTEAIWVDNEEQLDAMIEELKAASEIAVDLEHHDYRSYYGLVCLMQISNREKDWVIDTLALRDELSKLNVIFTNHEIVKVFHGAFMDIIWLQRDLGLYIVSLFDTYHASRQLGFAKFSLQYLLDTFAHFRTSKKYQLADWRIRPLPAPMLAYARSDTHFLLYIYDQLRNKLIDQDKLSKVLFELRQVAKRRFEYTKYRPLSNTPGNGQVSCPIMASNPKEPWGSIMYQYNVPSFKKHIVEVLYKYRDAVAREEDESVRYIMPNQLLVSLSMLEAPVETEKVLNSHVYVSEHVRMHAKEIASLINLALKDSEKSDWALVDKWHSQSLEHGHVSLEHDVVSVSIESVSDVFDKLLALANQFNVGENEGTGTSSKTSSKTSSQPLQVSGLESTSTPVLLIDNSSQVFGNGVTAENSALATAYVIDYSDSTGNVNKQNFTKVRKERLQNVWRKLYEFNSTVSLPIVMDEVDSEAMNSNFAENDTLDSAVIENVEVAKPLTGQQKLFSKDALIDPHELITLRKSQQKTNNRKSSSQELEQEQTTSVDYANADKILIDADKKRENNKKKKRSFDPYSNMGDGPRPVKKGKSMTSGRTSTFKMKKK